MEHSIKKQVDILIDMVRECDDYRTYRMCTEKLANEPEKLEWIRNLRKASVDVYRSSGGDLFERSQELYRTYERLQTDPLVRTFLESEESVLGLLREIENCFIESVELHNPII